MNPRWLLILGLFWLNCELKSPVEPIKAPPFDFARAATQAWAEFRISNFDSALVGFNLILERDSTYASANTGKGWCLLLKADSNNVEARHLLEFARADTGWTKHCLCGLIVLDFNQQNYTTAISGVNTLLKTAPQYYFRYYPEIDWHDLRVLQAQAYFFLKNYQKAWEVVKKLSLEFKLDPAASDTWVIEGIYYFSFEAALSKALELLSRRYWD